MNFNAPKNHKYILKLNYPALLVQHSLVVTHADPNGKIDKNCEYIGLSDAKKHDFNPPVNNYMGNYRNDCKNEFTVGQ